MSEHSDADAKDAAPAVPDAAGSEPALATSQFIVRAEVERVLSEARFPPDPARLAAGWERRFIAEAGRAEEMMQLYRALGFETAADPLDVNLLSDSCVDCAQILWLRYRTIYTRRAPEKSGPDGRGEEDAPHA